MRASHEGRLLCIGTPTRKLCRHDWRRAAGPQPA
nr:MAG TPA: hypothetical protein [Caudoviricetes sp.]